MLVSQFEYPFDPTLIAQHPVPVRDQSRLLLYERSVGKTSHTQFSSLFSSLKAGDLLVLNNTRVFPARLWGKKKTGGKVELLLIREVSHNVWEAITRGKISEGSVLFFSDGLEARVIGVLGEGRRLVRFFPGELELNHWLDCHGEIPLPPYIKREEGLDLDDRERYQTIFSKVSGSVAAPTAGLHFTRALLETLGIQGVIVAELTLHVGPGTFLPIRSEQLADHVMHPEQYCIPCDTISAILKAKTAGGRVIAVGTTTTRALESAFNGERTIRPSGQTSLFIQPGYRFRVVDGLITNFHLPRSTLLMLVSAFLGWEKVLSLYQEAVRERYRFYSFGDALCIL